MATLAEFKIASQIEEMARKMACIATGHETFEEVFEGDRLKEFLDMKQGIMGAAGFKVTDKCTCGFQKHRHNLGCGWARK